MDPAYPKAVVMVSAGALGLIRGFHTLRKPRAAVTARHEGWRELVVLGAVFAGFIVPVAWATTSWFACAEFDPQAPLVIAGAAVLAAGLWLFHHTHTGLGANWSARLQIVDTHRLVTAGVYRHIRHPMYLSLLLYGLGQMLAVPNWIAGPSALAGAVLLVAMRIGPEEAMMRDRFGREYDAYVAGTGRILPRRRKRP
jgi:protein-S-isoprenylcysteine O-methyltransferase Ste14